MAWNVGGVTAESGTLNSGQRANDRVEKQVASGFGTARTCIKRETVCSRPRGGPQTAPFLPSVAHTRSERRKLT